jgi:alcohol dehydrogenase class IV
VGHAELVTGTFALQLPPRILFGEGTADAVPDAVAALGERILIVTGSDPRRFGDLIDAVAEAGSGSAVVPVAGEPTVDDARTATEAGHRIGAEAVVGIGGGSVLDLAKAAAMLLGNGGDPLDYLEVIGSGAPITRAALPLVALPTTAGTGSEVTANAVLAAPDHRVKASLRSPLMLPRMAVVDPVLTLACPPAVTAASGMDALTQCLEPYVSNRANPVTDGWARTGLQAAGRGLRRAFSDGDDLVARTDMAMASLMGGLALANAKLGAVHGFAAVIGGMTDAPHGAICAALLAPVYRANIAHATGAVAARYTDAARWLTGDPQASALDGLRWIEHTREQFALPPLSQYGLGPGETAEVVAKAARASSMQGNPTRLANEVLAEIYLAAV